MIRSALLLAPLLIAATRDTVPPAEPDGAARSCIPLTAFRETRVYNDSVIDFVSPAGRTTYRVTLPQACPGLGFEQRFSYETSLSQLCAQDIITVFSTAPVMRRGSCGLAPFQPVRLSRPRR